MDDIAKELITAANSSDFRSYPKEEALCDSCLGRLFGRVGTGFTNAERGRVVRESLDVQREGPCSLCSGLMDEIPKFARLVESALSACPLLRTRSRATSRSRTSAGPMSALASPLVRRQPFVRRPTAAPS